MSPAAIDGSDDGYARLSGRSDQASRRDKHRTRVEEQADCLLCVR